MKLNDAAAQTHLHNSLPNITSSLVSPARHEPCIMYWFNVLSQRLSCCDQYSQYTTVHGQVSVHGQLCTAQVLTETEMCASTCLATPYTAQLRVLSCYWLLSTT